MLILWAEAEDPPGGGIEDQERARPVGDDDAVGKALDD